MNVQRSRRQWIAACSCGAAGWLLFPGLRSLQARSSQDPPTEKEMLGVVDRYFQTRQGYQDDDLIHQADAMVVVKWLDKLGWTPTRSKELVKSLLQEDDFLVRLLATRNGQRFMRKVNNYKLIYDRLDRIARVNGGERMLIDLVKLPDAERYAPIKPHQGCPNMLDLLPKERNGRTRTIKDYEKPTGGVYTAEQLADELVKMYREDFKTGEAR